MNVSKKGDMNFEKDQGLIHIKGFAQTAGSLHSSGSLAIVLSEEGTILSLSLSRKLQIILKNLRWICNS